MVAVSLTIISICCFFKFLFSTQFYTTHYTLLLEELSKTLRGVEGAQPSGFTGAISVALFSEISDRDAEEINLPSGPVKE